MKEKENQKLLVAGLGQIKGWGETHGVPPELRDTGRETLGGRHWVGGHRRLPGDSLELLWDRHRPWEATGRPL